MAGAGQTYGQHLPDQVERISELSDAQLELLADIRDLHRERAALEREYAAKLQLLAKKAADKKAKKAAALVLGSEPTKAWDDAALKKSTLDTAYSQLIASIADAAQDHVALADSLTAHVVDALKATERRHEDAKKKQMQYYQKLLSERDRVYADRIKSKQKYDDECNEVELYRQKQERSADDRHAERAAKQYEQQQIDMFNSKNAYLISIAVANKVKDKFYSQDLPALENQFQDLQTSLIKRLVAVLREAQTIQSAHLDALRSRLAQTESALGAVDPSVDQDLFIDYNIVPFVLPSDWAFEPCSTHYDHGEISVEPAPKVYLQNRLGRCRAKLAELDPVLSSKRKEADQLTKLVSAYTADSALGNAEEISDNHLETVHQLTFYETSGAILSAENDTISAALNGDEGGQSPHTFKSSSFSIPTTCGYCKSSIWGLSKQGKTCKACGISVHSKCELKLPADCSGSRHGHRAHGPSDSVSSISSVSRSTSVLSHAEPAGKRPHFSFAPLVADPPAPRPRPAGGQDASATPTPSSFAPTHHVPDEQGASARVLFDYTPTSPFELAVTAGCIVHVLEEDDGSGWIKVADEDGAKGLVPASYIQPADAPVTSAAPSAHADAAEYVKGIYRYQAQGPDELDVEEGAVIELTAGPTGGRNYADGWWEGLGPGGKRGIFPSNYVELVQ